MMTYSSSIRMLALSTFATTALTCFPTLAAEDDFPPQPPVAYLSPQESHKHFQLPEGYRLELVLAEPQIKEPVVAVFDGNGRMFVAEMRTYMQDIDGNNQHDPVSRVSLHEDKDGDGTFETHSVFIDKLLLPRMILPLDDALLVGVTDTNDLFLYRDTDGDGVADEVKKVYEGGKRGGNLEHQPSGLIWAHDNWLYTTYTAQRLRYTKDGFLKEGTAPNGGQWGLTQDDYGKPWFINAGGEKGPVNFQANVYYGAFNVKDQFAPEYMTVYPLVPIPDVQGGTRRFHPEEKTLNHFTATCGAEIYRGDRLPEDIRGDLLFAEPVGRLIRRTKIEVKDGLSYLRNAEPGSEFIRSTDPNFRPVNMVTAPDGTLYIVDMYRGIIQEGNWVREGSYLRKVVQQYSLDKNAGRGRIWRLIHDDFKPDTTKPGLQTASAADLVKTLAHPNGWHRDNAQRLLVLRGDKDIADTLSKTAKSHSNHLARIHAIWTLEGLNALTPAFVKDRLTDKHPQVRIAALRAGETLIKAGDKELPSLYTTFINDPDPNVANQAILTANKLKFSDARKHIEAGAKQHASLGVKEIAGQILNPPKPQKPKFSANFTRAEQRLLKRGEAVYKELCYACHSADGKGMQMEGAQKGVTLAPPFAGSETLLGHPDAPILVVLHGLTGPVKGKKYDAQMVPMASNDDQWIASVLTYIRNSFGNRAPAISPRQVKQIRKQFAKRTAPWSIEELKTAAAMPIKDRNTWAFTASHKKDATKNAVDGNLNSRYDTGTPQVPGMWFTIDLKQEAYVGGLRIDAAKSARDYPRGYEVALSLDGKSWSDPVASGKGETPMTEILFKAAKARHIRITQTGSVKGLFWSIHEMEIYQSPISIPPSAYVKQLKTESTFE
jgi:mono/diheme cytochrome c family protein/glucose/arabinose dehydrogenase